MTSQDIRRLPPVSAGSIRFVASDGSVHSVPERWLSMAYDIDPGLRTIPGPDPDILILTGEDRLFLWECQIEQH